MATIGSGKKSHVGLWITLVVVLVIIITPVALAYGFLYDPTHKSPEDLNIDTSGEKHSFTNNLVVDCFDETTNEETKHPLMLHISENDLNQTLYDNIGKSLPENIASYVPAVYLEIQEDNFSFYIELDAYGFFKSRLILVTELNLTDDPKGLYFDIKELKIARLSGITDISMNLLSNLANDEKIGSLFANSIGLSIQSHIFDNPAHRHLFYAHDDFVNDIDKMLTFDGDIAFFKTFLMEMFDKSKFNYSFYEDKAINGRLPMVEFHDNEEYCSYDDYIIDFNIRPALNSYLIPLLENESITKTQLNAFYNFFAFGYEHLNASKKQIIDEATFLPELIGKSIAEYDNERKALFAQKGAPIDEVVPIADVVSSQISEELTDAKIVQIVLDNGGDVGTFYVDEDNLHDVLKSDDAVGYGDTFYRKNELGQWKLAFFAVDNLYMNIVDDNIYLVFGLNVNGYETQMILNAKSSSGGDSGKIYFDLNPEIFYYGSYKCSQEFYDSFLDMMDNAMSGSSSGEWFYFDSANERLVVDFSQSIENNSQIQELVNHGLILDITVNAIGAKIEDKGKIEIQIQAHR